DRAPGGGVAANGSPHPSGRAKRPAGLREHPEIGARRARRIRGRTRTQSASTAVGGTETLGASAAAIHRGSDLSRVRIHRSGRRYLRPRAQQSCRPYHHWCPRNLKLAAPSRERVCAGRGGDAVLGHGCKNCTPGFAARRVRRADGCDPVLIKSQDSARRARGRQDPRGWRMARVSASDRMAPDCNARAAGGGWREGEGGGGGCNGTRGGGGGRQACFLDKARFWGGGGGEKGLAWGGAKGAGKPAGDARLLGRLLPRTNSRSSRRNRSCPHC